MTHVLEFNLEAIPKEERFNFWREHGSIIYRPLPQRNQSDETIFVESSIYSIGDSILTKMKASSQAYERTSAMIRKDGCDHYGLILLEKGKVAYCAQGHETTINAGDLLLLDMAQGGWSEWTSHMHILAIFPRDLISQPHRKKIVSGRLASCLPQARLLVNHMRSILQEINNNSQLHSESLSLGLASLVGSYFSQADQVESLMNSEQTTTILKTSIRNWIGSQLHRKDLNTEIIANHFHLSRATLYRLFEPEGGVRHYIQDQRLRVALSRLREGLDSEQYIGMLASSLGFNSLSAFSNAFRKQWGVSPRTYQKEKALPSSQLKGAKSQDSTANPSQNTNPQKQKLVLACRDYYTAIKNQKRFE